MPEIRVLDFPAKAAKKEKKRRKYEMPDGTFKAKPMINGKRYTVRGKSTKDVEAKIAELKQLMSGGIKGREKNMLVSEWADIWFDSEMTGKAYRTRENAGVQIKFIKANIGHLKLRDVREIHLKKMVNKRLGMSSDHIRKTVSITKRLFCSARRNGLILIDPSLDLSAPKGTYTGHRCLAPWEIDLVLRSYDCCPAGKWAALMLLTGLRVGEALALSVDDFDLDHGMIHVSQTVHFESNVSVYSGTTKTSAGVRTVPMPKPLISIIAADFAQTPRKIFAATFDGKNIPKSYYRSNWEVYMKRLTYIHSGFSPETRMPRGERKNAIKSALKPVHFTAHDLRYTYATMLFDAGVDEKTAQLWLGHTSPKMTRDLYAKLTNERKAKSDAGYTEYFKRFDQYDPT